MHKYIISYFYSYSNYDRSEAERVLFTNTVDSLVREPARPDPALASATGTNFFLKREGIRVNLPLLFIYLFICHGSGLQAA